MSDYIKLTTAGGKPEIFAIRSAEVTASGVLRVVRLDGDTFNYSPSFWQSYVVIEQAGGTEGHPEVAVPMIEENPTGGPW